MTHFNKIPAALLVLSGALMACDAPTDAKDEKKDTSNKTDTPTAKDGPTKPAAAKPKAKPAKMVEHDLSSAHEVWKGWVAQGPEGAKVLANGIKGARIAGGGKGLVFTKAGGDRGFDVNWQPGKMDLKNVKENLEKAKKFAPDLKLEHKFLKDEADALVWTSTTGKTGTTVYNFIVHMQIDGADYTCKNNAAKGAGNEAEHKRMMAACNTLKKK